MNSGIMIHSPLCFMNIRSGQVFLNYSKTELTLIEFAAIFQKQQPERFVMKIPGKRIDFPRFAADFRGKGSKTQVELFYGIPIVSLYHAKKRMSTLRMQIREYFYLMRIGMNVSEMYGR